MTTPPQRRTLLRFPIPDSRFPIPNSQFPIPNSQFPIPNSQFPIPNSTSQRHNTRSPKVTVPFNRRRPQWAFRVTPPHTGKATSRPARASSALRRAG
ncbi:hypothetical protein EIQ25_16435 [Xanthomonas campestris pv. campestris]